VHFTREPIIESILSARDGFKLVLKNSKTSNSAEISAEVIEIVSFSGSVFYRSQDRSKNFLVPAADFEIAEVKDARLVLKNISLDKSNKMQNPPKEQALQVTEDEEISESNPETDLDSELPKAGASPSQANRLERRRERRRNRRRRHTDEKKDNATDSTSEENGAESLDKEESSGPMVIPTLNLIPPPTTLISQTLARYKEKYPQMENSDNNTVVVEEPSESSSFETPLEPEDLV
jgi:hypothetical protein